MKRLILVVFTLWLACTVYGCKQKNVLGNGEKNGIAVDSDKALVESQSTADSGSQSDVAATECQHLWSLWTNKTVPSCEKSGIKIRECLNCSQKEEKTIAKLSHSESDWIIDNIAGVGKNGNKHTECIYCKKQIKSETIPAVEKDHIHEGSEWLVTAKADCVNDGRKVFVCSCGYAVKNESIKASGHTVLIDKAVSPSCTSKGLTQGSHCSVCNVTITQQQIIAAKGHAMNSETKSDTSTGTNYILHYCTVCSYSYREDMPTDSEASDNEIYDANGIRYYLESDGNLWVSDIGKCTSKNITIPSRVGNRSVVGVYSSAFTGNTDIQSVNFAEGITTIGVAAFLQCKNLKSVNFPSTLKRIENTAFSGCSIENLILPNGLEYIGNGSLGVAGGKIVVPNSVQTIGNLAFARTAVEEVVIPGNVTLGISVFKECQSLKKVTIGNGLKTIPNQTFMKCTALAEINLPDSITFYGTNSFYGCSSLTIANLTITASSGNSPFSGVKIKNVDVYTNIASNMFSSCSISNITLHEGVTEIDQNAFVDATISNIVLPSSLKTVDSYAFYRCEVDNVVFKGAVSLGRSAFKGCTIKTVTLPSGSYVGQYVFVDCAYLQTITFGGTKSEWISMISIPNYGYNSSDFTEVYNAKIICSDVTILPQ